MGGNNSKEQNQDAAPKKELTPEEIRQIRLQKLAQQQNEAEEEKNAQESASHTTEKKLAEDKTSEKLTQQSSPPKKDAQQQEAPKGKTEKSSKELDPEEIRKIRLQKLASNTQSEEVDSSQNTAASHDANNTSAAQDKESGSQPKDKEEKVITEDKIKSTTESREKPAQVSSNKATVQPQKQTLTPEQVLNKIIEEILECTSNVATFQANPSYKLIINPSSTKTQIFSPDNFDDLIFILLQSQKGSYFTEHKEKLYYILGVYQRAANKIPQGGFTAEVQKSILDNLVSYFTSMLVSPETFSILDTPENPTNVGDTSSPLLDAFYDLLQEGIDENFWRSFLDSIGDEEGEAIMIAVMKRAYKACSTSTIENIKAATAALEALKFLIESKSIFMKTFYNHSLFIPPQTGPMMSGMFIQKGTILGCALGISALPADFPNYGNYFGAYNPKAAEASVGMLREKVHSVVELVFGILEHIVRKDEEGKRKISEWMCLVLQLNLNKQKSFPGMNMMMLSTDGFMSNFGLLMLYFCKSFLEKMDNIPARLEQIDSSYLSARAVFKGLTLMNGKENKVDLPETEPKKFKFLTELFFLTNQAFVIQIKAYQNYLELLKKIQNDRQQNDMESFKKGLAAVFACNVHFMDNFIWDQLFRLLMTDCLYIASTFGLDINNIKEPFTIFDEYHKKSKAALESIDSRAGAVPENYGELLYEYSLLALQVKPDQLMKCSLELEIILDFMLVCAGEKDWLHNPHIRAKFQVFMDALLPIDKDQRDTRRDERLPLLIKNNAFYDKYLLRNLMILFIQVEKTGAGSQFYDKLNYRHHFCRIINNLAGYEIDQGERSKALMERIDMMTKELPEEFLQFVNLLMNDLIYLLDESLSRLRTIKKFQDEEETEEYINLPLNEKQQRMDNYNKAKHEATIFLTLLNQYYALFASLTAINQQAFLSEELKDKVVNNLNYCLAELNGKNSMSLKVKNMKELRFNPKFILKGVINVYLNLRKSEGFLKSVVEDERSFDIKLFEKTLKILVRENLLDEKLEAFEEMMTKMKEMVSQKAADDDFIKELDIPDEFMDPLTYEIMKDPVLLPSSKTVVDRLTVMKHLLSDPTDPFNRSHLTKEMLIPQPELKQRIDEFFAEKRKERKAKLESTIEETKE